MNTKCNSCYSDATPNLFNGSCVSLCPMGYTSLNDNCTACSLACATCGSSPMLCTTCNIGYKMKNNNC